MTTCLPDEEARQRVLQSVIQVEEEVVAATRMAAQKGTFSRPTTRPSNEAEQPTHSHLPPFCRVKKRRRTDGRKLIGTSWKQGASRTRIVQQLVTGGSADRLALAAASDHSYGVGPTVSPPPDQNSPPTRRLDQEAK